MTQALTNQDPHAFQCMEIWGNNDVGDRTAAAPGVDVYVHSQPYASAQSGGDIHYVSLCAGGYITRSILADVAGHGTQVEAVAKQLRDLLRKNINTASQKSLVRDLNNQFTAQDKTSQFATAVVVTMLAQKNYLSVCNAGHPRPLFYCAEEKSWRLLIAEQESEGDLPLGIASEVPYSQFAVPFNSGDILLLYTDGLIEATNKEGAQLGEEGLLKMARSLPVDDLARTCETLLGKLEKFRQSKTVDDDLTLMFLRHNEARRFSQSISARLRTLGKLLHLIEV